MSKSPKYDLLKSYWDQGLWNEIRMRNAVVKNWLTAAEFKQITGLSY